MVRSFHASEIVSLRMTTNQHAALYFQCFLALTILEFSSGLSLKIRQPRKVRIGVTLEKDDAMHSTEEVEKPSEADVRETQNNLSSSSYKVKAANNTNVRPQRAKGHSQSLKAHHVHFQDNNLLPSKTSVTTTGCLRDGLKEQRSKSLPNNAFKNLAIDDANQSTSRRKITPRCESLKELALPHQEHFVFDDDSAIFLNRVDDLFHPHSKPLPKGESDEVYESITECNEEEEDGSP
mmetsp:Transcript_8906/g.13175  ORF Transcript_8906/g.13175 Transcript_8906/m.13175 type:complete len:236 (+) Transcript_8906:280-987(+)